LSHAIRTGERKRAIGHPHNSHTQRWPAVRLGCRLDCPLLVLPLGGGLSPLVAADTEDGRRASSRVSRSRFCPHSAQVVD
jgi:hypothetical protein